jgi:protein-S-isoprenylcysteine O-methyltransferase Ste14
MRFIVFVLLMVVCLVLVVGYACLVAASEADERAEQIFKEYMEYKKKHQ